jgi:orotidine-5'-phosphate decarboxylase
MKAPLISNVVCRRKRIIQARAETSKTWKNSENLMSGATKAEYFTEIRIVPDSFLLVPGVGAQEEVFRSM